MSDPFCILRRDDAFFGEHRRMGLAGGDVLPVKVAVEIDRGVDVLHERIGSAPKRPPHILLLMTLAHEVAPESCALMTDAENAAKSLPQDRPFAACSARRPLRHSGRAGGGIRDWRSAKQSGRCGLPAAVDIANRIAPLAHGEVAAFAVAQTPFRVPECRLQGRHGDERTLADWRGRTVLLNLWATWCVPCRREMPALDALQAKLGGPDFEVVAVNIDTRDPQKPLAFLKEVGVTHLAYFSDPQRARVRRSQNRRQGLRHADDADRRPQRLRDRHHGGPRRMGERRRREIGERGDRGSVLIPSCPATRVRPSAGPSASSCRASTSFRNQGSRGWPDLRPPKGLLAHGLLVEGYGPQAEQVRP